MDSAAAEAPNPHDGGRCDASPDGGVGFYSTTPVSDGRSVVECPNGCGWWREFDEATGQILDGDHALFGILPAKR